MLSEEETKDHHENFKLETFSQTFDTGAWIIADSTTCVDEGIDAIYIFFLLRFFNIPGTSI